MNSQNRDAWSKGKHIFGFYAETSQDLQSKVISPASPQAYCSSPSPFLFIGLILLIWQELMVCEFYSISLGKFYQGSKVEYIHLNWQSGALSRVCSYVPINLNSYLVRKHYANYFIFWTIRPRKRKKIYITEQSLSLQPPFISISILTL